MSATKIFTIGETLTANDLNSNFAKLPFATSAFSYVQVATVAPDSTATAVAVAFPASRFSVAPIVTVSTSSPVLTAFVSAITPGTATINVRNNGNGSSAANVVVTGFAIQMTSSTAAG
jgi:hypothetical protein